MLDSKKLKTPGGAVFSVASEPLALAVAHEWDSQKDLVILSQMHLTGISEITRSLNIRLDSHGQLSVLGKECQLKYWFFSGLCNTAIDNPTHATKYDLVDNILNFLDTDTIMFFSDVSIKFKSPDKTRD